MARTGPEDTLLFRVGRAIARHRGQLGWTQDRLGVVLGISVKNVQRLESGRPDLRVTTLWRVAQALGTSIQSLLTDDDLGGGPHVARREGPWAGLKALGWTPRRAAGHLAVPVWELRPHPQGRGLKSGDMAAPSHGTTAAQPRTVGFALPPDGHRPPDGAVLARLHEPSALPHIAPGSWCLFVQPVREPRVGSMVLARLRHGSEAGYALRWLTRAQPDGHGTELTLRTANRAATEERITAHDPGEIVVAELVGVLGTPAPMQPLRSRVAFDGSGASV